VYRTFQHSQQAILPEGTFVYSVAFSPNGQTLAAGDARGHIGLWDVATRQRIAMLPEGSPVQSVAFSANNQTLAAGDFGGHIGLWDVATRRRTATLAVGSTVDSDGGSGSQRPLRGLTGRAGKSTRTRGDPGHALRPQALYQGSWCFLARFQHVAGLRHRIWKCGHLLPRCKEPHS
jgi:hypothetical protein